jgi:hypothetical protein
MLAIRNINSKYTGIESDNKIVTYFDNVKEIPFINYISDIPDMSTFDRGV